MYTDNEYYVLYALAVFCFLWFVVPRIVRSKWWKTRIAADFPEVHPPICADCHETSCKDCPFNK